MRSQYDYILYYSTDDNRKIDFLLVVQVDDYVYTGTEDRMNACQTFLSATFEIVTFGCGSFSVMGCTITQREYFSIVVSDDKEMMDLNPPLLLDASGKVGDDVATLAQANVYRHVIGKMLYIGRVATSTLADLRTHHLRTIASIIIVIQAQCAELHSISPTPKGSMSFVLDVTSDGASGTATDVKECSGFIIFRRLRNIIHPVQWSARALRRVSRSSCTAEILAAADAAPTGMCIHELLLHMTCSASVELTVDFDSLLSLSTSVKEP